MAVVAVTADNNRIAVATAATDTGTWGNDGGGGGVADEPDIVYQGTTAQSRKVSTSRIGRDYTHGSGTDMTATNRRHYIAKINATNSAGLVARTTPAMGTKIGSGSGAYYEHYLFGNDNYPPLGGFQVVAISPNVAGYRDATTGSPTLTSVLYWSLLGDFSATSKAENLVIDAIDIGAGLHLVGGDGASTDGVFQDFVDADRGISTNRWGYVTTRDPVLYVTGRLAIGRNTTPTAVATVFQDSNATVVWENGLAETGFHRLLVDLGSATTDVDLNNCSLQSTGEDNNTAGRGYTTTEDTRTILEVVGTAGAFDMTGGTIDNFAEIILTTAATLTGLSILSTQLITQAGGTLDGCVLSGGPQATGEHQILATNPSNIKNCDFTSGGAGHAVRCDTIGTYNWTGNSDSGYTGTRGTNSTPSSGSTDAMFYNNSGGLITLNVGGGGLQPSVRNGAGATTTVVASVTLTVTVKDNAGNLLSNIRVIIVDRATDPPTEHMNELTVAGVATETYSGATPLIIDVEVRKGDGGGTNYFPKKIPEEIGASGLTITVTLDEDTINATT